MYACKFGWKISEARCKNNHSKFYTQVFLIERERKKCKKFTTETLKKELKYFPPHQPGSA